MASPQTKPRGLLALDTGRVTGWCALTAGYIGEWASQPRAIMFVETPRGGKPSILRAGPGARPKEGVCWGSLDIVKPGMDDGDIQVAMRAWLADMIQVHDPLLIAIERNWERVFNADQAVMAIGLYLAAAGVAKERGVHVNIDANNRVKHYACGHGASAKDAMMAAARRMGFVCADDHQADAVWLADYALARTVPRGWWPSFAPIGASEDKSSRGRPALARERQAIAPKAKERAA